MLMMHAPKGTGDWNVAEWTPDDLKAHIEFMMTLNADLSASGELAGAKKDGTPMVTDGPFTETKEFLAGYWIVNVPNAERAYAIAARASSAPGRGGVPLNMPIEVREVMSAPPA
jgi:hypothetical protein